MAVGYGTAVIKSLIWKLFKIGIAFCVIYAGVYCVGFVVEFLGRWSGDLRFNFLAIRDKVALILTGVFAFFVFIGKF